MVGWIDEWWLRLLAGLLASGFAAAAAYHVRSLSLSGAWSAVVMGTGFVTLGEPVWFGLLIAFFISSSAWSRYKRKHRTKALAEAKYEKTGRRDAGQVWANGGAGLLLCAAHAIWPDQGWLFAYIGVMAAVNADTWATEIGALSKSAPRSVTSGKPVTAGTSGGVTPLGSAAALAGAVFIGAVAALLLAAPQPAEAAAGTLGGAAAAYIAAAAAAGLAGAFADSLLGATGQAMFRCQVCGSETERAAHCGSAAVKVRGFAWLNNDRVNLLSSLFAGALAWLIGHALL
ncbi:uncharacterized protein (TIGR00297 family) [Paenibacillus endophyticus]|uniref:Uncharacterized protein (TIGR00297 family) n=1 Tax=Paenibacillus endophyticus TaxID=1294268 RepID=A0A7W5C4W2_9BACL|nr:DUF92 domain-containing protein [Paenibacillus endophyticus]MBB3151218.1 uncharacterized protein (TIGR00297 family) [Paenibacillus endophyticus]